MAVLGIKTPTSHQRERRGLIKEKGGKTPSRHCASPLLQSLLLTRGGKKRKKKKKGKKGKGGEEKGQSLPPCCSDKLVRISSGPLPQAQKMEGGGKRGRTNGGKKGGGKGGKKRGGESSTARGEFVLVSIPDPDEREKGKKGEFGGKDEGKIQVRSSSWASSKQEKGGQKRERGGTYVALSPLFGVPAKKKKGKKRG